MKTWLTAIACVLAVAAAIYLLNWPIYSNFAGKHATLVEINGLRSLLPAFFPVFLTVLPFTLPHRVVRITVAIILGAFVYVAGMSIGLYYAPAALMLLLAACVPDGGRIEFREH